MLRANHIARIARDLKVTAPKMKSNSQSYNKESLMRQCREMLSQFGEFKGHIQPKENHNVCQCVQGQTGCYKPVWEEPLLPSLP